MQLVLVAAASCCTSYSFFINPAEGFSNPGENLQIGAESLHVHMGAHRS